MAGIQPYPTHLATEANAFMRDLLSPFLNHHRACLFPVEVQEARKALFRIIADGLNPAA